jgi:hypothetical protein
MHLTFTRLTALTLVWFTTQACAVTNPVNEQFSAMSPDDRGQRIASMLSSRGQACSSIQREVYQGQFPDGTALWSFSCFNGSDHQLVILPNQDIRLVPCEVLAKNPGLQACFAQISSK